MVSQEECDAVSDAELAVRSEQQSEWFYCLMKRYETRLFRYVRRISGISSDEAEDVLQEVFIKSYSHLHAFDPRLAFSSWIYRIAHNETISFVRKKKVRPTIAFDEDDAKEWVDEFDIMRELDRGFDRALIERILAEMDEKYREVLVLRFVDGMDYVAIADVLQKPLSTIGNLIARGRARFVERYEELAKEQHV
jgi:RNA polymerase sigma-70 factor (ECF subfamily)